MTFPDPGIIGSLRGTLTKTPGGITISGIAKKTKLNRNLIAKYLDYLLLSGQLEMKKFGSAKIYSISERVPVSALMDYSSDLVLMLDHELRVLRANDQMLHTLSDDNNEILGKCVHTSDNPFLLGLSKILRNGRSNTGFDETEFSAEVQGKKRNFQTRLIPVVYENGSAGTVLLLNDITENREHSVMIAQHESNQAFIHKKACELGDLLVDCDIWEAISVGIKELYPGAIFLVNSFNPQVYSFTIRCFFERSERDFLSQMIGRDIIGLVVNAPDGYDRKRSLKDIGSGKVVKIPGNFYVATFGNISKEAADIFEKTFNIGDLYTVGLVVQGVPLGNVIIFMRKGEMIENIDMLEIYARQAALALKCQSLEKERKDARVSTRSLT